MVTASSLRPGDVGSFQTSPFTAFGHPSTGRHAALKVLATGEVIAWAVLEGVFPKRPALSEVMNAPVLLRHRFAFTGQPAVTSTPPGFDPDLLDFAVLGSVAVTQADLALVSQHRSFAMWRWASLDAEGEWRWRHDREALRREVELSAQADEAKRRAERDRRESRLRHLTWEVLLTETPLPRWSSASPSPPGAFTEAMRVAIRDAVLELRALGPKPRKGETRRVLRTLVRRVNALDAAHGQVIETEEREELCELLGDLASVAGHPTLIDEIDEWRSW